MLEDRLLTKNDLEQFLELILATLCDRLQIDGALLIENRDSESALNVIVGDLSDRFIEENRSVINDLRKKDKFEEIEIYQKKTVIPIVDESSSDTVLLGFIATKQFDPIELDKEERIALRKLTDRAATALKDRKNQDSLFLSLEILTPQVTAIQSILASSRFNKKRILNGLNTSNLKDFEKWVKDALNHFFGGPKLSQSPLIPINI